jgi:hypothetical protein
MNYLSSTLNASIRYDGLLVQAKVSRSKSRQSKEVIKFGLTKPANVATWRDPPHVALANVRGSLLRDGLPTASAVFTRLDLKSIVHFMDRYGAPIVPRSRDMSDIYEVDPTEVAEMQFVLRSAWHGDAEALNLIAEGDQEYNEFAKYIEAKARAQGVERTRTNIPLGPIDVKPVARRGGMKLVFTELWSLARWLFLVDYWNDRIGICSNKSCFTPYFILKRKGQRYCSHDCAMVMASRRYRRKLNALIAEARAKGKWPGRRP